MPNLFFFTGLHDEYHTPQDTVDLIDTTGAVRIATVVGEIAMGAATAREPFIHRRDPNSSGADDEAEERTQPTIRVGIIPADAPDGGLLVHRVFDNTSASEAGLLEGDIVTHWNGRGVTSVGAWSPVLLTHNPGDTVTLGVNRGGDIIEIEMTLKGIE